ncbi:hypothetical protein ABVK25_008483 [Lepraria finkii]|uniref:Uncharacterized protein n=1 Tax=Lepraria finkii TaxID=1340010 RepID=A0ABR4B0I8_9LECA
MFITFTGTLMQITRIFENCWCASNFDHTIVSLAGDTQDDRQSSWQWNRAGYIALIFLACVTYLGWWCQRYLREKFIERVKNLIPETPHVRPKQEILHHDAGYPSTNMKNPENDDLHSLSKCAKYVSITNDYF